MIALDCANVTKDASLASDVGELSVASWTVSDAMISARGLRKSFGDFEAVKGIDVEVRPGEAFGFLGPNGAGKSSTMRMIAAVSPVTGGELRIFGLDPAIDGPTIRGRLGVCPQDDNLDNELNVRDNLYIYGRYFGLPRAEVNQRVDELLDFVQLTEKAGSKVEGLSGGMKRRLTIARSLVNKPDLLLLDEPTTGLDPQARHVLWDRLFRLKQSGVTLVLTTHYMDEAEQLCDRLVVMDKGLIVAEGSPLALIREHSTREVAELRFGVAAEGSTHEALAAKVEDLGERVEVLPDRLLVYSEDGEEVIAKVHERGLRAGRRARAPLHARGRLPAPHRPDAGGLMSWAGNLTSTRDVMMRGLPVGEGIGRQVDYWWTVYRRTWRGTIISSFLSPIFYVVAMGVLLGGFIEADPAELEGATSYLAFIVPGLVAAHAMQTAVGETTYPVMGMIKWQRVYDSMLATPLQVVHLVTAHLLFVTFRVAVQLRGVHAGADAVRRLRDLVGAAPGLRLPGAGRDGLRRAGLRLQRPAALRGGLRDALPARHLPAVPVLGSVLPDHQPRRRRRLDRPAHPAVARRQPVADVLRRTRSTGRSPRSTSATSWSCSSSASGGRSAA